MQYVSREFVALSKIFIENIKNVPSELGDHEIVVQYTHTESDCQLFFFWDKFF